MKFRPVVLAVAASLAAGAVSVPTFAAAQSYGGQAYGDANYDPCIREARQRQTSGAVLGAILGAAAGSGVAAKGAKTEGGALGAAVGAMVGAKAGQRSAACGTAGQTYGSNSYGNSGFYGNDTYGGRDYGYREPAYDPYARRDERGYDDYRRPVSDVPPPPPVDSCRLAESPIYLPDGRTEMRYVRVCPDQNGRYRVVD